MIKALILKSARRNFTCKILDGGGGENIQSDHQGQVVIATAKGNLLKDDSLAVGDNVVLTYDTHLQEYSIAELIPRKSLVTRKLVREKKIKAVAANIDLLVIVTSAHKPLFKQGLIDRFLVRSAQWEIPAIIVFNKMDIYSSSSYFCPVEQQRRLLHLGVKCYEVSAQDFQYQHQYLAEGIIQLKQRLHGKRAIFLGQSGVGKSKLISRLSEGRFDLLSAELGKVGKGAHTTTWAELIMFKDWELVDSPGIRSLSLNDLDHQDLIYYFPDLLDLSQNCAFTNCDHSEKAKGCYFHHCELDQHLRSRFDSYQKLKSEILAETC